MLGTCKAARQCTGEPDQINKTSSMYCLYSTICLRKWLISGVSSQIMNHKDCSICYREGGSHSSADLLKKRSLDTLAFEIIVFENKSCQAKRSTCDMLVCSAINHFSAFILPSISIKGYSAVTSAEVRRSSCSGEVGIVSSRQIKLSDSCSTCECWLTASFN